MSTATATLPVARSVPRLRDNGRQLQHVADEVGRLDYGEVRIVVCGGNIVEVDATAKKRFSTKD